MAESKAKKSRNKLVREGKRNPSENRSQFAYCDLRSRVGKSKKGSLYQEKYKERLSYNNDDGSFDFEDVY